MVGWNLLWWPSNRLLFLLFLSGIILPSFPLLIFFLMVFCLATKNKKLPSWLPNWDLDLPTCLLPYFLHSSYLHMKGNLMFSSFSWVTQSRWLSLFAFVAADTSLFIDSISLVNSIPNVLHLKPHLAKCLKRTDKALSVECIYTLGMLIIIQMLSKFHSKKENIKPVRVRFR